VVAIEERVVSPYDFTTLAAINASAYHPICAFIIHEVVKHRPTTTGHVFGWSVHLSATHYITTLQAFPKGRVIQVVFALVRVRSHHASPLSHEQLHRMF
tara:strand:- start:222 stop:518 length:297 start_codon:yes stop_codon:yes gene_type:complete